MWAFYNDKKPTDLIEIEILLHFQREHIPG